MFIHPKGAGVYAQSYRGTAEKRKLLCCTLNYYWMDKKSFLKSMNYISLLRTHEELPRSQYDQKIRYTTFLVDLSKSKEELFASFDYTSARYKINKAVKNGVVVRQAVGADEKRRFYDFYREFVEDPERKNQILALKQSELERLVIYYALSPQGEYLGGIGLLPSPDGRYLLYKYAATQRKLCENDLLVWHGIQHGKDSGFAYFDMSWMGALDDKDSKQYRLFQYKKKFGGEMVNFYSFIKLRGPFKVPGLIFKFILKHFFNDDINNFTLCLKRIGAFR
jgi:lipid II:glycine glycyltransferase (peptidoglycan interpeptide bridge formation enzyme)